MRRSTFKTLFSLLLLLTTIAPAIVRAQQSGPSTIVGTWALTYVAPQDVMNTMPNGVTNTKFHFTESGKLYALAPDATSLDSATPTDYAFDGKRLMVRIGSKQREMSVVFVDDATMALTQAHEAKRVFKRIDGFRTKLEPQSLQLVMAGDRSDDSRYDLNDYARLPLSRRMEGMWEVIAYERMPADQLPPYGFFNDLWRIDAAAVTIYRREPPANDAVTFVFNGKLTSSGIGLGGPVGSKIEWTPSFNEWGQLVLNSNDCRVILKRTTVGVNDVPTFPIKVVLVRPDAGD